MPFTSNMPERSTCVEAAGRIVVTAIQSGKIDVDANAVGEYFAQVYRKIAQSVFGK